MAGVLAYDQKRDARQFAGRNPVIAHPPCRTWSKYLRQLAKPTDLKAEQDLAFFCLEKVLENGGVLEQPAGSHFWKAAGLPVPNAPANGLIRPDPFLYTLYVEQQWFGYGTPKPTWLLVAGVPKRSIPPLPFSLRAKSSDATSPGLSQFARSRTVQPFAEFLCQIARETWWQFRR